MALSVAAAVGVLAVLTVAIPTLRRPRRAPASESEDARRRLFAAIQPVSLANCDFARFGEDHDGGYLLCANLLADVGSGYSYGISGYDKWGCDVSARRGIPVHQYDCFDLTRPACPNGNTVFHAECIGGARRTEEGRLFDTLEAQVFRNGDEGRHLVVKMDVEAAEWDSLLATPKDLLEAIDQLVVEFHGFDASRSLPVITKLGETFHVANLHWNNCTCRWGKAPFPSYAYEILFVNKRIGVLRPGGRVTLPNPLDRPNRAGAPDCQLASAPTGTGQRLRPVPRSPR